MNILLTEEQFNWLRTMAHRGCNVALQAEDLPMPGSEDEAAWIACRETIDQFNPEPILPA